MKKILCASGLFLLLSGCGSSPEPVTTPPVKQNPAKSITAPVAQNFTLPKLPQITAEQNADTYLRKAQGLFVDPRKPSVKEMRDSLLKGTNAVDQKTINDFLATNKALFEMMKKAAATPVYVDSSVEDIDGMRVSNIVKVVNMGAQINLFYALQVKALQTLSLEDARALTLLGNRRQANSISILPHLMGQANETAGLETIQFILKKKTLTKGELTATVEFIRKLEDPFKSYGRTLLFERKFTLNELKELNVDEQTKQKLDVYYSDFISVVSGRKCHKDDGSGVPRDAKTPGDIALRSLLPTKNTTKLCELISKRNVTIKLAQSLVK
ncbi:hypothetical protein KBD59_04125 [Candidatus Gracilibacteria bacterium]|nr:hypothetical protein [Candidatus Gracilibacteria bacterium]